MDATVHKFPSKDGGREWLAGKPPVPEVETFAAERVQELAGIVQHVVLGCQALMDFVTDDRELARQAGIESLALEIGSVFEGEKFDRVVDAVSEAVRNGTPVTLTRDGLGRVRRLEGLLAEASKNVNRFTMGGKKLAEIAQDRATRAAERRRLEIELQERRLDALRDESRLRSELGRSEIELLQGMDYITDRSLGDPRLGQAKAPTGASDPLLIGSMIVLGAITVTLIVYAATTSKR